MRITPEICKCNYNCEFNADGSCNKDFYTECPVAKMQDEQKLKEYTKKIDEVLDMEAEVKEKKKAMEKTVIELNLRLMQRLKPFLAQISRLLSAPRGISLVIPTYGDYTSSIQVTVYPVEEAKEPMYEYYRNGETVTVNEWVDSMRLSFKSIENESMQSVWKMLDVLIDEKARSLNWQKANIDKIMDTEISYER